MTELTAFVTPACPYFRTCGGCAYQNLSYETQLTRKRDGVRQLFQTLGVRPLKEAAASSQRGLTPDFTECVEPVIPSPEPWAYRNRSDLSFRKTREGRSLLGFMAYRSRKLVEIDRCLIARPEVNRFLQELKQRLTQHPKFAKYRRANVTVKVGGDGRVEWGGLGRRSLELPEERYLWVSVEGKRIHYSLDTFFQINSSAIPLLVQTVGNLLQPSSHGVLFDLYSGVGLFAILFSGRFKEVIGIEESASSHQLALYNQRFHGIQNAEFICGSVERCFPAKLDEVSTQKVTVLVDPPRRGLSPEVRKLLSQEERIERMVYVSCSKESLARDLKVFLESSWQVQRLIPIDLFPQTEHLELVALLVPG